MEGIPLSLIPPEYLAADRSRTLIHIGIAFIVLDTLFISLFFFTRLKCRIPVGIDGWLLVPGYLLCLAHCIGDFRKSTSRPSLEHPIAPFCVNHSSRLKLTC